MAVERKRVGFIDIFRAFGIILMVMGHIKFGEAFDKWIHAFHMPMFFFISGWFYGRNESIPIKNQLRKKIRFLIIPYFVFSIIEILLLLPIFPEYRTLSMLNYIFFNTTTYVYVSNTFFGISPVPGALWFLTALFFAEVIYLILDYLFDKTWKLDVAVIALAILGMLANQIFPFRLPWSLDAAFVGIGFFHMAKVIKGTKIEKVFKLKNWQALVVGIVISLSIMLCPKVNMRTGSYGWFVPFWINAFGAIVAGWNLSRCIEWFLLRNGVFKTADAWLKGIGQNSIVYLCMNQIVILFIAKFMNLIGFGGMIAKILILIITMAILFVFEKLICNTKLKVMVGKQ